jgi:hypothetical protein
LCPHHLDLTAFACSQRRQLQHSSRALGDTRSDTLLGSAKPSPSQRKWTMTTNRNESGPWQPIGTKTVQNRPKFVEMEPVVRRHNDVRGVKLAKVGDCGREVPQELVHRKQALPPPSEGGVSAHHFSCGDGRSAIRQVTSYHDFLNPKPPQSTQYFVTPRLHSSDTRFKIQSHSHG